MESILFNISQVLGITIIHSLWQGMLVYFVLRLAFAGMPAISSVKKYQLAIFAIMVAFLLFIYTLLAEAFTYNWVSLKTIPLSPLSSPFNLSANSHFKPSFYAHLSAYLPYICAIYITGLVINLAKLGLEWNKIRQIKRSLICAEQMQQFINSFSKKLDITKHIRLKFSELVDVPCIIGYFKPLILLPVSLSLHLSACEVEAILLHELSHIKRNDYLINLLQQAISVMLFFNPFAGLINRIVNQERENSCDDLVIAKTGKPLIYARALLKLETARAHDFQLALAITGKKFYLLKRIERIMKTQKQIGNMRNLFIAVLLFAGGLGSIAWFNPSYSKITSVKVSKSAHTANLPADSSEYIKVSDTLKKYKHKGTIIAKNKSAYKKHTKKLYQKAKTGYINQYKAFDTTFSDSIASFYHSPEWRSQMETIRKQGEELRKKFDSPEWRAQTEAIRKQGEEIRKKFDSPEWRKQMEEIRKQGVELRKKFDTPEWRAQMEVIRKNGEEIRKKFDTGEWKNQMLAMQKQGEEIRKKFDSPEWKEHMDDLRKQGEEMRKKFDSPEWKKQMKDIQKQGEDMRKKFDSPEWKKQMKDIQKQGEEIRKQFNSPEWKQRTKDQKWVLKDTAGGVQIYTPKKDTVKN